MSYIPNADSIVYQAQTKLGDLGIDIARNMKRGMNGSRKQKKLWKRAISILMGLEAWSKTSARNCGMTARWQH